MAEGWAWPCQYCGKFWSKRTAYKHDICEQIYLNDEFMRDQIGWAELARIGSER